MATCQRASPRQFGAQALHAVMGTGGAPEGVITAAAMRCLREEMVGRLVVDTPELREREKQMGITDPRRILYRVRPCSREADHLRRLRRHAGRASEGQRLRWAEKKAAERTAATKHAAKKRGLTVAGRNRLSDLMKARASKNPPKPVAKKRAA
jgi:hypothetical protein